MRERRVKVAVCFATFERPRMLAALLGSIGELVLPAPAPELLLVAVDNDAAGSAQGVLQAHRTSLPWPLVQAVEPERNIARARNRCVALALEAGADFVAFVDDDEQVTPGWLAELLRVQADTGADIVGGSVENRYAPSAPRWIVDAGLPRRPRLPTGAPSAGAETSNVLIARHVFALVPGGFDEAFGLSGGSDSLFFLRARRAGARITWANEAIVRETFPGTRTTARWLLRRAFRTGNSAVFVARAGLPLAAWLPRRAAAAAYRLARGLLLLPPALLRGRAELVGAGQDLAIGAGALAALAGYRYVEYTRSHGT